MAKKSNIKWGRLTFIKAPSGLVNNGTYPLNHNDNNSKKEKDQ